MHAQQPVGFGGARNPGAPFGAQPMFNNAPHQRGPVQPHQYNAKPVHNQPIKYAMPVHHHVKPHVKSKVEVIKQNPKPAPRQQNLQTPHRNVEQPKVHVVKEEPRWYSQPVHTPQYVQPPVYNVQQPKVQVANKAPSVYTQTAKKAQNIYNPFQTVAPHIVRQLRAEQVKSRSQFPTSKVIAGVAIFCLAVFAAETRSLLLGGILTIAVGAGIVHAMNR